MWCTTECWDCEDQKCEHYISKTELYFENQRLKNQLQQKENIIKEIRETVKWAYEEDEYQGAIYTIEQILDKDITKKSDYNYEKVEKENKK